jgi:RNA 2',3'-cyclic 3'-phosphodiesterase
VVPEAKTPVRCFVALELEAVARGHVAAAQSVLHEACDVLGWKVRWVAPEHMHITLKFLGDLEPAAVHDIAAMLDAYSSHAAIPAHLGPLGWFLARGLPKVLWLGVNDADAALPDLAAAIDAGCVALGHSPEARPFHAHITLGRVRRAHPPLSALHQTFPTLGIHTTTLQRLTLFESQLGPGGPTYHARASIYLSDRSRA